MLVLSFAGGTQLFVEPTVLGSAALGVGISKYWSPNQLAWFVASQYDHFNEAAAISVVLLVLGLCSSPRCSSGAEGCSRSNDGALRDGTRSASSGSSILLFFTAFFFVPIIWLFLAPTKTDGQLLTDSPFAFGSLSTLAHTFHRIVTYSGDSLLIWLKNSAIYSFGGTALAIVAAIPAGYGLALTQFIGRRTLLSITLVVMIMPATALVLPLFLEINKLGLYGTVWSLILPFGFFPFGVYLAYIYFSSTIPKDLLAAARIDGANEWGVFRHIALPLARPIVGLVGFFAFVASWNNFFLPFVMTYDNSQYPVQIGLQQLIGSTASFNPANYSAGSQRRRASPAGPRDGGDHRDRPGADRVPVRAAHARHGDARRSDQGIGRT